MADCEDKKLRMGEKGGAPADYLSLGIAESVQFHNLRRRCSAALSRFDLVSKSILDAAERGLDFLAAKQQRVRDIALFW